MFSSLRFKGTLSQIIHAAYPIVCFPLLVRTFLTYRTRLFNEQICGDKRRTATLRLSAQAAYWGINTLPIHPRTNRYHKRVCRSKMQSS